jgi:hypothetical protein
VGDYPAEVEADFSIRIVDGSHPLTLRFGTVDVREDR